MSSASSGKLRTVFDTNIHLAAYLRPGLSETLMTKASQGLFELFCSKDILDEITEKLQKKMKISEEDLESFLDHIDLISSLVATAEKVDAVRDTSDNKILECAISAQAHLIISMDKDLLDLKTFRGIAIVHPNSFRWMV